MLDPAVFGATTHYLAAVRKRMKTVELRGQAVGPLRPSEAVAIMRFLADWGAQRHAENVELAVDLEPDARKSVVVFQGLRAGQAVVEGGLRATRAFPRA